MNNPLRFEHLQVMQCRHGVMLWPRQDGTIGRALALYGEFADGENRVMARYVTAGDCVVDVGANLGTTALPLARATGPQGQVLAFEPQPLMAQLLQTTLSLNECFHVRVITSGLADTAGWARIPAPGIAQGGNYGAVGLGHTGLPVPVMRLDDMELSRCTLVKIDVEGLEWQVIQGAQGHLLHHRPVVYLEAKRTPGTVAALEWLMSNGWQCYWHFAFFFRPDNFRQNPENVFGGTGDMNVLAVPAGRQPPKDLPAISQPDEDWRTTYEAFFRRNPYAMP
jgi:FkbM family methyltransferase